MIKTKIVVGIGFGDEGKGNVVSYLCETTPNPIVARFNGGHQAGHGVNYNGIKHIFSMFGSGTLQGVPTYWDKNCTFYPIAFLNELEVLKGKIDSIPTYYAHPLCPITLPFDVDMGIANNTLSGHGSVGVGFGATIERHEKYHHIYLKDLWYPRILEQKIKLALIHWYKIPLTGEVKGMIDDFIRKCVEVTKIVTLYDEHILLGFATNILEGAQGVLLDQDHGFFPHVTRSCTTSKWALELIDRLDGLNCNFGDIQICYVSRPYHTRHGAGPLFGEVEELEFDNSTENNVWNPHQGDFRVAPLQMDLFKYALEVDNIYSTGLYKSGFITCCDQVTPMEEQIQIFNQYHIRNITLSYGDMMIGNNENI